MKGILSWLTILSPRLWVSILSLTSNWIPLRVSPVSIVMVSSKVSVVVSRNCLRSPLLPFLLFLSSAFGIRSLLTNWLVVSEPVCTVEVLVEDQTSSHAPQSAGLNPVFGSTSNSIIVFAKSPSTSTTFASSLFSFTHTSLAGFNSTLPIQVITANGLTFSVLVANGCLIYSSSV